jgi:dienelactone hydrolase
MITICSILALTAVFVPHLEQSSPAAVSSLPIVSELPDPFLLKNGKRIETKRQWANQRRTLLDSILQYEYGKLPPIPDSVSGTETASRALDEINATEKEIRLRIGRENPIETRLILTLPQGKGTFPVIVRGDGCWGRVKAEIVAEIVQRGYALAEFDRTEIAPDSAERRGVYIAYPDYQGGRLAAWAWGYHRVIDYLLTRRDIDRRRIIITGHSRGGKATLLAGATDERIALTAPNNSGCGGAGCYRLQAEKSEDIAAILKNFPFWFAPNFGQFIGQIERLPFDQHTLKALVAPRALLTTEALGDLWANPRGTQATHLAAREVYRFLDADERLGIVFRSGKHEHNADDWNVLLDFADAQLLGRRAVRRFDHFAFPELPFPFSWRAP